MPPIQIPNLMLVTGCDHFLTITLEPTMLRLQCREQYKKTFGKLAKLLQNYCDKYLIVIELTKDCNVHYHLLMTFHNNEEGITQMLFLNDYKRIQELGFKKLEKVSNLQNVFNYLIKEIPKTYKVINPKGKVEYKVWEYFVRGVTVSTPSILNTEKLDISPIETYGEFDDLFISTSKPKKSFCCLTV